MKPTLKDLATFLRLHNGVGKPKINFQNLYKLFPHFEFEATKKYGLAQGYNMLVSDGKEKCLLTYKEYDDGNVTYLIHMESL